MSTSNTWKFRTSATVSILLLAVSADRPPSPSHQQPAAVVPDSARPEKWRIPQVAPAEIAGELTGRPERSISTTRASLDAGAARGPNNLTDCPPSSTGQLPDTLGHGPSGTVGVISDANPIVGFIAADNFSSPVGGLITQVRWWGSYVDFSGPAPCIPPQGDTPDQFTITYFNDNASVPGAVLAGPFPVIPDLKQPTGRIIASSVGSLEEFVYDATHPSVPIAPDVCYWIQIENNTTGSCAWIWETAPPGDTYSWQSTGTNAYDLGWCMDISISPTGCQGPCDVACSAQAEPESEPGCGQPTDTVNGGCNSSPPVFSLIECGDVFCGTAAYDGVTRDTDWYQLSLSEPTQISFSVEAEFAVVVGLVDNNGVGDCAGVGAFLTSAVGGQCAPTEISACLPSGSWWLFVAPQFAQPVDCGAEYEASLDCVPCVIGSGACCVPGGCLVQNAFQCGALGGTYLGDGTDCAIAPCAPNDVCLLAEPLLPPVVISGATFNATPDAVPSCDTAVDTAGVWYQVEGTGTTMIATTCSPGTEFDTRINVYCGSCQSPECVVANDDFQACPFNSLQSSVEWCSDVGRAYYILVHGFGGETGLFDLDVSDDGIPCPTPAQCTPPPPCELVCDGFAFNENEPGCGLSGDTLNGGCDAPSPAFTDITCGSRICATSGAQDSAADADWYALSTFEDSQLTMTLAAEFNAEIGLFQRGPGGDPCGTGLMPIDSGGVNACATTGLSVCISQGDYLVRVAPVPGEQVPCGRRYMLESSCVPCVLPPQGACCLGETCLQTTIAECAGTYLGDNTACAPETCLPPPETCDAGCADTNGDGRVDGADVQSFSACILSSAGGPPTSGCTCADTNLDGLVGTDDISSFVSSVLTGVTCREIPKCIYKVVCREGDCVDCPLNVGDECQSESACPNGTCSVSFTRTCGNPTCCVYYQLVDCRIPTDEPPCPPGDFCVIAPPPGDGPQGACCLDDGSCIITSEGCCEGEFQGAGTDCDPTGACCLADGSCVETTEECCLLAGGVFHAGSDCSVVGACCLGDGSCVVTTEECCMDAGGTFHAGSDCDVIGACCLADGSCVETTEECCMDVGGTFHADSDCALTGACCLADGSCVETTEECCMDVGGTFHADADCSMIGACCLVDGTCIETTEECCMDIGGTFHDGADCSMTAACCLNDGTCIETTMECCMDIGGTFHDGADCSMTAACCLTSGACIETTMECCMDVGGTFHNGANCSMTAACCLTGGACIETTMECCMDVNGTFHAGADCSMTAACCLTSGACIETTMECCMDVGGTFHAGDSCTPTGACCLSDGSCVETTMQCCMDVSGTFHAGGNCTVNVGACCRADDSCIVTTRQCCNDISGNFQGGPTCVPNPCPNGCTVEITDENDVVLSGTVGANVAIRDKFKAKITPMGFTVATYQWTIDGAAVPANTVAIKTYEHEEVPHSEPHTVVFNSTNLAAAHLQTQAIDLFWTREGDRRLRIKVTGTNGDTCETEILVRVRNVADPNRTIYSRIDASTDTDHNPAPSGGKYRVRWDHGTWHFTSAGDAYDFGRNTKAYDGKKFLTFHDGILNGYDAWAEQFGQTRRSALSTGIGTSPTPTYSYLVAAGGGVRSHIYKCVRLGEFKDLDQLGDDIESWHVSGHNVIGGDMNLHYQALGAAGNAFWRWHKRVDGKRVEWLAIKASPDHDRATIASTVPANNAVNVPNGGATIAVMFNKPVSTNADTDNTAQTRIADFKLTRPDASVVTATSITPNAGYTEHTFTVPAMTAQGLYTVRIKETPTGWHVPGAATEYVFSFTVDP